MSEKPSNAFLGASLTFAVFLWGASNAGTKYILAAWPPVWTGGSRFVCAGLLLLAILRFTKWLGTRNQLTPSIRRLLLWRTGLGLAIYILIFNVAVGHTAVSHVALYLGASPVWALLWEGRPKRNWESARRYGAAGLALIGVAVLFWPTLKTSRGSWLGEVLALTASVLWTHYGRQCRAFGAELSGAEITAHTMWRAGLLLLPLGLVEVSKTGLVWRTELVLAQTYCIVGGAVAAFAIWSNALRHWPTSQVLLFNNLIPVSTMTWAHFCLGEHVTPTFWAAMALIMTGVVLGQGNWAKFIPARAVPPE